MKRVCLFRHGIAEDGTADDRVLTQVGRKKTGEAARGVLALRLGIDAIVSSPLPRAKETAEILARVLELKVRVSDALRPGGKPLDALRGLKADCPVLVGHEPDLSRAAGGRLVLKKAGLAVLEDGALALLATPRLLRRLAAPR